MGRRKIEIKAIKDDRNRSVTFLKRKGGLFKKAHELSVLCSVDVAVFVFGNNKKLYEYSSADMRDLIARYQYHGGPNEHKGPGDFNGGNDDDDDDDADQSPPNVPEPDMMPQSYQQQPTPFQQHMRHPTPSASASVSPPMHNGSFANHPHHPQRGHTPQPAAGSRPVSRNDGRRMTPGLVPHGAHAPVSYMTPPMYPHNHAQPNHAQPNHGPPNHVQAHHPQQPPPPPHVQQQQPNHGHPPMVSQPGHQYSYPAPAPQPQPMPQTMPQPMPQPMSQPMPQPMPQSQPHPQSQPQPPPQPHQHQHQHQHPHQHQHQHQHQQHYMEDRRLSAPPAYASQTSHPMPATSRVERSPPQHAHHHSQSIPQISTTPPQSERRDPQPPPPIETIPEQQQAPPQERAPPQPPLLNTDTAIKKLSSRKVHSIFTPIEENRSILSQHVASFTSDGHAIKMEPTAGNATTSHPPRRPYSMDATASGQTTSPPKSGEPDKSRTASLSSVPERTFTPPSRSSSFKTGSVTAGGARPRGPRLTVQIPDGGSDPGSATGGDSVSPRPADTTNTQPPHRGNSMVLPPPSPSASALLSAGASGPPNPFARPVPQPNRDHVETPASALPSRFLGTEFLPSPSSFYNDWNYRATGDNTLPSPLNFGVTPIGTTGPSFLRDDFSANTSNAAAGSKRKTPETGDHASGDGPEMAADPKRVKVE